MITLNNLLNIFETGKEYCTRTYTYRRFMETDGYSVKRIQNKYFGTTRELNDWQTVAVEDALGIHIKL